VSSAIDARRSVFQAQEAVAERSHAACFARSRNRTASRETEGRWDRPRLDLLGEGLDHAAFSSG
jgi:hypothetical protein